MKIKTFKVSQVKPYWRNPRNNEDAVDVVAKSIEQFGFNQPLVIDQEGVIIVGHTRYQAMVRLGRETVPCVVVDMPEEKAKAYRIADNKTAEFADWDEDKLIAELREFTDSAELQSFFDEDLDKYLQETAGSLANEVDTSIATAEQIQAAEERKETGMAETAKARADNKLEVICPHCLQTFMIDRASAEPEPATE
jgi:ParB-like chromosome segregation protein Spo0J